MRRLVIVLAQIAAGWGSTALQPTPRPSSHNYPNGHSCSNDSDCKSGDCHKGWWPYDNKCKDPSMVPATAPTVERWFSGSWFSGYWFSGSWSSGSWFSGRPWWRGSGVASYGKTAESEESWWSYFEEKLSWLNPYTRLRNEIKNEMADIVSYGIGFVSYGIELFACNILSFLEPKDGEDCFNREVVAATYGEWKRKPESQCKRKLGLWLSQKWFLLSVADMGNAFWVFIFIVLLLYYGIWSALFYIALTVLTMKLGWQETFNLICDPLLWYYKWLFTNSWPMLFSNYTMLVSKAGLTLAITLGLKYVCRRARLAEPTINDLQVGIQGNRDLLRQILDRIGNGGGDNHPGDGPGGGGGDGGGDGGDDAPDNGGGHSFIGLMVVLLLLASSVILGSRYGPIIMEVLES